MTPSIYGISADDEADDANGELKELWERFLTDYLQEFQTPNAIDDNNGGEFDLSFEYAIDALIAEDIMISEQWLDVLEVAIYLDPWDREQFTEYAKRVRAYHAKAGT